MREGRGTLKELTALWRELDPRGKWELVETAYGIKKAMEKHPECSHDMPSYEETMKHRSEVESK